MADAFVLAASLQAPSLAMRTAHMAARLADLVGGIGADANHCSSGSSVPWRMRRMVLRTQRSRSNA